MKKLKKDILDITTTGVGLSVMAGVTTGSPHTATALGRMGKGLGNIASIKMAGHTMGALNKLIPKKKKSKKYY